MFEFFLTWTKTKN